MNEKGFKMNKKILILLFAAFQLNIEASDNEEQNKKNADGELTLFSSISLNGQQEPPKPNFIITDQEEETPKSEKKSVEKAQSEFDQIIKDSISISVTDQGKETLEEQIVAILKSLELKDDDGTREQVKEEQTQFNTSNFIEQDNG